jgi:hypothetical protein
MVPGITRPGIGLVAINFSQHQDQVGRNRFLAAPKEKPPRMGAASRGRRYPAGDQAVAATSPLTIQLSFRMTQVCIAFQAT